MSSSAQLSLNGLNLSGLDSCMKLIRVIYLCFPCVKPTENNPPGLLVLIERLTYWSYANHGYIHLI